MTAAATTVNERSPRAQTTAVRLVGLGAALLVLILAICLSLSIGSQTYSPGEIWTHLWNDPAAGVVDDPTSIAVDPAVERGHDFRDYRVPRTLLAILVGAALGVAGALMQALTRNPLADPGILGVNAGAAAAVVVAMATLGVTELTEYVWFAILGAGIVSFLVYGLGSRGPGGATPVRLTLAGTAVTAALTAFVAGMVILQPQTFEQFRFWELGSLAGRRWDVLAQVSVFIGIGLLIALTMGRALNVLALGEDTGRALGMKPARVRAVGAFAIVLLCGAATAAVGPIGFVGLVVPHMVRAITGPDQRWILPYCLVLSPSLLLVADVVGRRLESPGEVQVAVVTALIGAPVFIMLIRRRRIAQL